MQGPLEESSIDCLDEGCNGRVTEALVCKFNVVGFVSLCLGEAISFNNGVARGTTFTGPGYGGVVLIARPSDITHGDGCSRTIAWYIGALVCSTWWLSIMCALLGLNKTFTGVVFAISSGVIGRVHKSVVGSLYPREIMLSL